MELFWTLLPSFIAGLKVTLGYWAITLVASFILCLPAVYLCLHESNQSSISCALIFMSCAVHH